MFHNPPLSYFVHFEKEPLNHVTLNRKKRVESPLCLKMDLWHSMVLYFISINPY